MVLDENEDIVLPGGLDKQLVLLEMLDGWLCHKDVVAALYRIQRNWVMCGVGGENGDCAARCQSINGRLVRVAVTNVTLGVRLEGNVEAVVDLGDVLLQMFACGAVSKRAIGTKKSKDATGIFLRIAGNLPPDAPTMDSWPTLPRRLRSNRVKATTPTFLSDAEALPPTKPVVYSPEPTWRMMFSQ